jgi:glycosyltransferase involved in cell wall biosynthesis
VTRSTCQITLVLATSTGGVGAHVAALTRGLLHSNWQVQVCGPTATDELFDFSGSGARFTPVPIAGAVRDPSAVIALRRATAGTDIVHAHGLRAATVTAFTGRKPFVATWHNAVLDGGSRVRRLLSHGGERVAARSADVTLAASEDLADRARELGGRDVRYGPVAISAANPRRSIPETRAALGLAEHQRLIVSIGRLHRQKGHDVLIAAAAGWRDLDAVVVIAGDGPLESELAAQINQTGAPVRLLGRRVDGADLLAAADVVVLASRWEARSLAAQEALHAGRPLVATAVGGMPQLVGDGAVLVPAEDASALEGAVRTLLLDPTASVALAARGLARAAGWPTEADTLAQVTAVYAELLGRSAGHPGSSG